ncbi:MAG: hypothetical protein ACRCYP_08315 [Alphaproteobacteria bacterium]
MLKMVWILLVLILLGGGGALVYWGIPAPTQLIEKKISHEKLPS